MSDRPSELLPCPFCKSSNVRLRNIRDGRQVVCGKCLAAGPAVFHGPEGAEATGALAISAWNTRARAIDGAATAQAGEWVLPHGWRIERVDARTLAVCGRGIRTHVEFGDSFYPFFLALSAVPPATQPPPAAPAEPSAENWRVAIANIFGADMIETVEQRAAAVAREEGNAR